MKFTQKYQAIISIYRDLLALEYESEISQAYWEDRTSALFKNISEFINGSEFFELEKYSEVKYSTKLLSLLLPWKNTKKYSEVIKEKIDKENLPADERQIFYDLTDFFQTMEKESEYTKKYVNEGEELKCINVKSRINNFLINLGEEEKRLKNCQYSLLTSPQIRKVFLQTTGLKTYLEKVADPNYNNHYLENTLQSSQISRKEASGSADKNHLNKLIKTRKLWKT